MKTKVAASLISLLVFAFSNCAVGPIHGVLFTSNSFPGEFNPANDVARKKKATGCTSHILGLVSFGNAGAGDIASENGITRIALIDHSTLGVLSIVFSQYCTIVEGE